jgi:hypothetical protein
MNRPLFKAMIVAAPLVLSSCEKSSSAREDSNVDVASRSSQYCLSDQARDVLEKGPVTTASARKLADYYGLCRSDGARRMQWLNVLAARGDSAAKEEIALIQRLQSGTKPK